MPGPGFDAREYLKVHRQQNKRLAQTREAFSGMLRALFFKALARVHASFFCTQFTKKLFFNVSTCCRVAKPDQADNFCVQVSPASTAKPTTV
jgi:hypothetical protein